MARSSAGDGRCPSPFSSSAYATLRVPARAPSGGCGLNPRLAKRIGIGVGIGAIVYLGLALFADWDDLAAALSAFTWSLCLPVLCLSLCNYLLRFARWQLYLKRSAVRLEAPMSLRIFFAGLVMSVTPGKLGEVLKAYLVKVHNGTPITRTGPIVVAERVTDLVALCLLLFLGTLIYRTAWPAVLVSGSVSTLLVLGLVSPRAAHLGLHIVERVPRLRPHGERVERAYESMRRLLAPGPFVWATALGVAAWFAECAGFAVVLRGFDAQPSLWFVTFTYAFATLVGALLLVPGGLGGTEATMVAMLLTAEVPREVAVAATLLTRIATLWFAVLLGALVLLVDRRLAIGSRELD